MVDFIFTWIIDLAKATPKYLSEELLAGVVSMSNLISDGKNKMVFSNVVTQWANCKVVQSTYKLRVSVNKTRGL